MADRKWMAQYEACAHRRLALEAGLSRPSPLPSSRTLLGCDAIGSPFARGPAQGHRQGGVALPQRCPGSSSRAAAGEQRRQVAGHRSPWVPVHCPLHPRPRRAGRGLGRIGVAASALGGVDATSRRRGEAVRGSEPRSLTGGRGRA